MIIIEICHSECNLILMKKKKKRKKNVSRRSDKNKNK